MSSIVFNRFKRSSQDGVKDYTYTDLHLDLTQDFKNRDIVIDYDDRAIKNSIINIFNTIPGQRYLVPEFGCNVISYLFEPVTEFTGKIIGETLYDAIKRWEPRVRVEDISVIGNPEEQAYLIKMVFVFPRLKRQSNLTGILTQEGFKEV